MNSKRKPRGGANRSDNRDRGGAARSNSTKTPDRETREGQGSGGGGGVAAVKDYEGVYRNPRVTHSVTSLIGIPLRVETQNNIEFEGILKTFSPQLEMVLEWVHEIDVKMPDCINHKNVKEEMVFPLKDIVSYYAVDVDLNFATKEEFQTDTQISNKLNGETPMKELEQWMPDGSEEDMVDLGEGNLGGSGNSNGWSAHDMFAKNKEFGVETSYDHNLSGYTIQLNKDVEKSAEYKERERKAAQIAAEIEGNTHSIAAIELENGDEEEAFSAVVRDKASPTNHDSPSGEKAYVPPGKRDQGMRGGSRGGGGGRGARATPPGNDEYRGNRYDNRGYNNNRGGYNNDRGERYERGGYSSDYRGERGDRYRQEGGRDRDRGYRKDDKKASPIPEQEKQVDRRKSGEGVMSQRSPGGGHEDPGQRLGKKSREQQSTELKEFQDNFQLAAGPPSQGPSKSPTSSTPRVSVKQSGASQGSTPLPSPQPGAGQENPGGAPPPATSPAIPVAAEAPSTPNTSTESVKKSTLNPNAKEFSLNPGAKEFTPRGPPSRVAPTPPRPQTPNTPNSMNAMAAGIPQAFSQAGPGAYILTPGPGQMGMTHMNVNNGMFVHAGNQHMMAAGGQPIASIAAGHPGQPQPGPGAVQVNPPYAVPNQTRPGPVPGGNQRGGQGGKEGNTGAAGRPDLPSPLQVAGHPIIAGGVPGHQPQFMTAGYPGPQPGIYPGHPSQGPPVIRMVMPGTGPGPTIPGMIAAGPGMVPIMSQADTGHSGTTPMWSGQGSGPGPAQHPPPTPPQPNTPAPSPGLPQMYSGPPGHHQPPSYPGGPGGGGVPGGAPGQLVVIPGHAGFPHNIPTSAVAGQPHPHMGGAPHMMAGAGGQPVTSMAQAGMIPQQFHYLPQHQGHPGPGAHMMPQHNQQ